MNTIHCYKKKDRSQAGRPGQEPERESRAEFAGERSILCEECGHRLTSRSRAVEMDGKHQHTFFNPAGVLFEIGCFSDAPGAEVWGLPTTDFVWFSGYSWLFANCAGCHTHIGWQFLSGESSFFGLVLNRLVDEN